jgi:ferredoxin
MSGVEVEVDEAACAGHGQCAATAPGVYRLDADGFCLPVGAVPEGDAEAARDGANACPEHAITVHE